MTHLDIALWGALPYVVLVVLVAGSAWRYRYDRFGFTTRSSQIHESRLLRVGGPLFHYALLFVIGGHVTGLLVPEMVTDRLDVSENSYHDVALVMGGGAGLAAAAGLAILLYRRLRVAAVRRATNRTDRAVYPLLAAALLGGLAATASSLANPYDYRLGVSVWFRSLFDLDPDVAAMAHAPLVYRLHALLGMALFALWPFSRLVHALTAPVWYLARPYVVYRSRAVPYRHPAAHPTAHPTTGSLPDARPAGTGRAAR
ncbi:respiratory nitrate reductase subunit gamma [Actinomadura nitritigenes]|uniref:Respiratory nitrate reductase subunit gamma n=1 Tax=Actinomadura nitritigenes TaxID=134602 RepID=A0ABS3RBU7_9ACTN|nr:respiratory nitrate reductase subunit gamma [Actinomadura nitritigenes]MBO2443332.1 respiratory nitrate reductase subunit gamma [Actinomadura nitritigenes]